MEPFFIFCPVIVLYCGYMTFIDLLRDLRKGSHLPAEQRRAAPAGRKDPGGGRGAPDRAPVSSNGRQIPLLSRGTA